MFSLPLRMSLMRARAAALAGFVTWACGVAAQPLPPAVPAVPASAASASAPAARSALDAPLFYQLLLGELELREGRAGNAYQVLLDAARRTRDEGLFARAVEIAVQARAGGDAMAAVQAWRSAVPASIEAARTQLQLAAALNRHDDLAEPLAVVLRSAGEAERSGLIASLPRLFQRSGERTQVAELLERLLTPYADASDTRSAARVAIARGWLAAGDRPRALALLQQAGRDDPASAAVAAAAIEFGPAEAAADALVQRYLQRSDAEPALQLAYVRSLMQSQRLGEAQRGLERLTAAQPTLASAWLLLGALHVELRHPAQAEAALQRYLALREQPAAAGQGGADDDDHGDAGRPPVQAWMLLAEAAEQRGDLAAAERWMARVGSSEQALDVQMRRASLLARQGKLDAARELIRRTPERNADDARAKLLAEAQLLRNEKRWSEAHEVLTRADQRSPNDADLIYELAMTAEKLGRLDEMERLLRRVIELRPQQQHAYNALGYSLADRKLRLPEARELVARALELAPGDPFITDSLGWVEFRLGRHDEALRLLQSAYAARPDPEIGAHLGEVLWAGGQHDEARRIWRQARERDAANEVLRETLARLRVEL